MKPAQIEMCKLSFVILGAFVGMPVKQKDTLKRFSLLDPFHEVDKIVVGESVRTAGGAQDLEILQEHSSLRCVHWAHPGIAWETAAPPLNPCYLLLSVWLQRSANVGANLLLCFPELKRLPSDVSFDSDSCFCKVVLPLLESWKWNVLPSKTLAGLILKINHRGRLADVQRAQTTP